MNKLLIDLSQILFSSAHTLEVITEDLLRHVILSTMKTYVSKFKSEYPEVIVCIDDSEYWRTEIFPYYKAKRKSTREKSKLDWELIFSIFNKLKIEFKESLPYKVLHVKRCEADDLIATICKSFPEDKILILGSDGDYKQLHNKNVKQYSLLLSKFVSSKSDDEFDIKLIKGDSGDGIPNILSQDDCFVIGKRQTVVSAKRLSHLLESDLENYPEEQVRKRFFRNRTLIDFNYIPEDIREEIINTYNNTTKNNKQKFMQYCIAKRLNKLLEELQDF